MCDEGRVAVVIDNGSDTCKAGLASPTDERPSFVAESRRQGAQNMHIIVQGKVTNWDDMEVFWKRIYNELRIAPEEHPVLFSDIPRSPLVNKERMVQIMFENLNIPAICIKNQAVLSLYAAKQTSGIVLDSGYDLTHTVPIYEGYSLPHAIKQVGFAGKELTDYLINILLSEEGPKIADLRKIARDIKERKCYVAQDFEQEMRKDRTTSIRYPLLDGQEITIKKERFRCPEVMFQPCYSARNRLGLHEVTYNSIRECNDDIHKDLFANIVLSGGSTMFIGFADRLKKEMEKLAPSSMKVNVTPPPYGCSSAWVGGSRLASQSTFKEMCISKREFDEDGSHIVNKMWD